MGVVLGVVIIYTFASIYCFLSGPEHTLTTVAPLTISLILKKWKMYIAEEVRQRISSFQGFLSNRHEGKAWFQPYAYAEFSPRFWINKIAIILSYSIECATAVYPDS